MKCYLDNYYNKISLQCKCIKCMQATFNLLFFKCKSFLLCFIIHIKKIWNNLSLGQDCKENVNIWSHCYPESSPIHCCGILIPWLYLVQHSCICFSRFSKNFTFFSQHQQVLLPDFRSDIGYHDFLWPLLAPCNSSS